MWKLKKRSSKTALRQSLFLLTGLCLRWPVWILLALLRPFKLFDYLFVVYPGTPDDLSGYCPKWIAKTRFFSFKPQLAGVISGKAGRGLVLVIPNATMEVLRDKGGCLALIRRLQRINRFVGSRSIALAGQLPSIITIRHSISLGAPFVLGVKGTVFSVMHTVKAVMERHGLSPGQFTIALVGVGNVGKHLLESLLNDGHQVTGIDIRMLRKGVLLAKDSYPVLNQADVTIVLTPRGSDFIPYVPHLKSGSIVIDDTHPQIECQLDGISLYKVAVTMPSVSFYPSLPGYRREWIPGCAIEAICTVSNGNGADLGSQALFNLQAESLGFRYPIADRI